MQMMLLMHIMNYSCGWKYSVHIQRDLFIAVLQKDEVVKVPCRNTVGAAEDSCCNVEKGTEAEQNTAAQIVGDHVGCSEYCGC